MVWRVVEGAAPNETQLPLLYSHNQKVVGVGIESPSAKGRRPPERHRGAHAQHPDAQCGGGRHQERSHSTEARPPSR